MSLSKRSTTLCVVVLFYLLTLPCLTTVRAQFVELEEIVHTCSGSDNGSIRLQLLEGIEDDYYFIWRHNGDQSLTIGNLAPGLYEFYIEDKYGCSEYLEFEIREITSCRAGYSYQYDPVACVFRIVVELYDQNGNSIPPNQFEISWNSSLLNGSIVTVPAWRGYATACYNINIIGANGVSCCSQSACINMTIPQGEIPCSPGVQGCKLIINEFAKSQDGEQFLELLVKGEDDCSSNGKCDIRNFIIDDNNGELIVSNNSSVLGLTEPIDIGVDLGYIRFNNHEQWSDIKTGSMIVLISSNWDDGLLLDPDDTDADDIYVLRASDPSYFSGFFSSWRTNEVKYNYDGIPISPLEDFIKLSDQIDGFQTRSESSQTFHAVGIGENENTLDQVDDVVRVFPEYSFTTSCRLIDTAYWSDESFYCTNWSQGGNDSPGKPNNTINLQMIQQYKSCYNSDDESVETVGIRSNKGEISANDFSVNVSPNPTMGKFQVSIFSSIDDIVEMQLFNTVGKMIFTQEFEVQSNIYYDTIEALNNLPSGTYLLKCSNSNKETITQYVIKIK